MSLVVYSTFRTNSASLSAHTHRHKIIPVMPRFFCCFSAPRFGLDTNWEVQTHYQYFFVSPKSKPVSVLEECLG